MTTPKMTYYIRMADQWVNSGDLRKMTFCSEVFNVFEVSVVYVQSVILLQFRVLDRALQT